MSDLDLLRQYTQDRSEDAFATLVQRHLDLVYSTALRQVRSPELAEEVAQSVFTDLARKASGMKQGTVLAAWLYQVARRTGVDVVRRESRRQFREKVAVELADMKTEPSDWMQIEPLLDEAMEVLEETDRSAILLRYFENKSLREVGEALGASEDAAQKRVSRAVEQMREFFSSRGVAAGAGAVALLISANAVHAAPAGLAAPISAALSAGAISSSAIVSTAKTIAMTTLQKTIISAAVVTAVSVGIHQSQQTSSLRAEVKALQEQQAPLTAQIQQLQTERDDAINRLAALTAGTRRLDSASNANELLKLRGKSAALQSEVAELKTEVARLRETPSKSPVESPTDPVNQTLYTFLGQPIAPPPNLNPAYTKDGVLRAVQIAAQNAGISLDKIQIEDSEFPYIVGVVGIKEEMGKLKAEILKMPDYTWNNCNSSDTGYAMNITPSRAFPQQASAQDVSARVGLRQSILFGKIRDQP